MLKATLYEIELGLMFKYLDDKLIAMEQKMRKCFRSLYPCPFPSQNELSTSTRYKLKKKQTQKALHLVFQFPKG